MRKKMNRKAYFFLIDAIFAVMILMIGFMIITSRKPTKLDEVPLSQVSENLMDIISTVRVDEICSEGCECTIPAIEPSCSTDIRNKHSTILDNLGERYYFYEQGNPNIKQRLRLFFQEITGSLYRNELYGIEVIVNGEQMYIEGDKSTSQYLITSKRVIFGYYENTVNGNVIFWGPYLTEVNMWEI